MKEKSPLASTTVKIVEGELKGEMLVVEDWWENVYGKSWMVSDGNPAALNYAMRTGLQDFQVPLDNDVLYGKIGSFGHLVHTSEIDNTEEG
jgi:hypothetical protein